MGLGAGGAWQRQEPLGDPLAVGRLVLRRQARKKLFDEGGFGEQAAWGRAGAGAEEGVRSGAVAVLGRRCRAVESG